VRSTPEVFPPAYFGIEGAPPALGAVPCGPELPDPVDIIDCVSPRIPAAIFPTPPATRVAETAIVGTPTAAPMPVVVARPAARHLARQAPYQRDQPADDLPHGEPPPRASGVP